MGVNRLVSKLEGATLPIFHTELFNIEGSWWSYRKNLHIQIFLKLPVIVLWTKYFHKTNKKNGGQPSCFQARGATLPIFHTELFNIAGSWWSYRKNFHIQIFLKLPVIVIWTIYFHKTNLKMGVNRLISKLGGATLPTFHTELFNIVGNWWSYRKNLHIQIFLKLPVIVLWTKYFHKTNYKMGVNRLVSKLGGATLPTFHTELFNIAGSWWSYRKNLHIQIFLKLPVIVLWTKYFYKTNFKMGVNRLVSKLGGATLPTFHTELFNIAGSWWSYRKNLHIQIFLKLPVIVLWTKYFHKTNFKMGVNRLVSKLGGATLPAFHTKLFNIVGNWWSYRKISTSRFFLNFSKLFLGPYIFRKQFKKLGGATLPTIQLITVPLVHQYSCWLTNTSTHLHHEGSGASTNREQASGTW